MPKAVMDEIMLRHYIRRVGNGTPHMLQFYVLDDES